jgi:AraC-like DNA-binding protein
VKKQGDLIVAASVFAERRFPLAVMELSRHGPTAIHHHEFHELVVILAGHGRHITDQENHPITAGDVFLIGREAAHAYADTQDLALVNILFDPQRLHLPLADIGDVPGYQALFRVEPKLRPHDRLRGRLQLTADELAVAAQFIARLRAELAKRPPGYRFAACTCLMELILYLSRCYSRVEAAESGAILRIGHVLSHIEKHYAEPMRVAQLARLARMSESSLLRTFRTVLGTTPLEHVIRVRIDKASELLRHDDVRVTEAAFQCGFRDSNYFARQFRKVAGRTPRQFQRDTRGLH